MASQRQIDANRRNAKRSTGPNTDDGKARSRRNAVRDGITGQVITLTDDDRAIFEKIKSEHIDEFKVEGIDELKLANTIVWDTWRLDRLRAAEMNLFASGEHDEDTYRDESKHLDRMSLYEQRLTRSIHKNREALRQLQNERDRKYRHDKKEETLLARLEDLKDLQYIAPDHPTPNGFVFSSEEIRAAAERQRNLEASMFLLANKEPWIKYGATGSGSPDLFANLPYRPPPDCIPKKIHGVSPESIALRKYYHPEEFEKRRR